MSYTLKLVDPRPRSIAVTDVEAMSYDTRLFTAVTRIEQMGQMPVHRDLAVLVDPDKSDGPVRLRTGAIMDCVRAMLPDAFQSMADSSFEIEIYFAEWHGYPEEEDNVFYSVYQVTTGGRNMAVIWPHSESFLMGPDGQTIDRF